MGAARLVTSDRWEKVSALLMEMHIAKEVYISNGQMGDIVIANVLKRCRAASDYSTTTIKDFILTDENLVSRD